MCCFYRVYARIGQISVDMVNTQSSIDDSIKKVKAMPLTAFGPVLSTSPAKLHIFSTSCSTRHKQFRILAAAFGPPALTCILPFGLMAQEDSQFLADTKESCAQQEQDC